MPQMMPINWLISLFLFVFIFSIFNILNYYILNVNFNNNKNMIKSPQKNSFWKW